MFDMQKNGNGNSFFSPHERRSRSGRLRSGNPAAGTGSTIAAWTFAGQDSELR